MKTIIISIIICSCVIWNIAAHPVGSLSLSEHPAEAIDPVTDSGSAAAGAPSGPSNNRNYILKRMYTGILSSQYIENVDYFDSRHNLVQQTELSSTPNGNNLVKLYEYNGLSQNINEWLPLPFSGQGAYIDENVFKNAVRNSSYYEDEFPFYTHVYENSSSGRLTRTMLPGAYLRSKTEGVNHQYKVNRSDIEYLQLLKFVVDNEAGASSLRFAGVVPDGTYYHNSMQQYREFLAIEIKDQLDRVIMSRVSSNGFFHDTYYVYDDFGNLCYVLPPELSDKIKNGELTDLSDNSPDIKSFAYVYKYDYRNRCIEKRLPGCLPVYMVYDNGDRLVLSQDGNQRCCFPQEWTYSVFDGHNRMVSQSIISGYLPLDEIRARYASCPVDSIYMSLSREPDSVYPFLVSEFAVSKRLLVNEYSSYRSRDIVEVIEYDPIDVEISMDYLWIVDTVAGSFVVDNLLESFNNPLFSSELRSHMLLYFGSDGIYPEYKVREDRVAWGDFYSGSSDYAAYYVPAAFFESDIFPLPKIISIPYPPYYKIVMEDVVTTFYNYMNVLVPAYFLVSGMYAEFAPDASFINCTIEPAVNVTSVCGLSSPPSYLPFEAVPGVVESYDSRTDGMKIYEKSAVLGGTDLADGFVERAFYYDSKGHIIQTVEKNHLGGISRYSTKYDFIGNVMASHEAHNVAPSGTIDTKLTHFTYDRRGRLLSESTILNHGDPAEVRYEYDELGRLAYKRYGYSAAPPIDHIPFLRGKYFYVDRNLCLFWGAAESIDPDGLFLIDDDQVRSEYQIAGADGFYYIPEHCLSIANALTNDDPMGAYEIINNFPGDGRPLAYLGEINSGHIEESFTYNVQGWLTGQNGNLFETGLKYYDPDELSLPGGGMVSPRYSGNITQWTWRHRTLGSVEPAENCYGFTYDGLSRLTDSRLFGRSGSGWVSSDDFRETMTLPGGFDFGGSGDASPSGPYDLNGNINYLLRTDSGGGALDEFRYEYDGNRLSRLFLDPSDPSAPDPYVDHWVEYRYDANGNMTFDGRKRLDFTYNFLNLVDMVSDADDSSVAAGYSWLADGTKLQVVDGFGNGYLYLGSFVYSKRQGGEWELESTGFGGGRIMASHGGPGSGGGSAPSAIYTPYYHITDHLGSVRVVFTYNGGTPEVVAQNDYYPFGLRHHNAGLFAGSDTNNRFLYNGKEKQTTGSLSLLDYGARMNDTELGRWFVADPLAEKYYSISPYVFCANNPIIFVDSYGRDLKIYYKSNEGKTVSFTYTGIEKNIPNNSFVQSVVTAVNYNINNGGGGPTQNALGPELTLIVQQTAGVSIHAYGNIFWNPEMGVETDIGNILSPATILDHEIDHGTQRVTKPDQYFKDTATKSQAYDNKEEVRVITGSEQVTASANGEIKRGGVTRTNHNKGRTVITNGVTSTKIDEAKTKKFRENEKEKIEKQSIEW